MIDNNVKAFQEKVGMSQEQLSRKSDVGQSTISEIESGRHTPTLEVAFYWQLRWIQQ